MPDNQIIVTGASKGIGAAIALDLAQRGFHPVCLSRSGDASAGSGFACDMTDEAAVRDLFAKLSADGPILGLVNNAGLHEGGPSATLETDSFLKVMDLNATAVMVASREAFPYLRQSQGRIVNIGSFFDKLGVPENLAYCASKAAVAAMTRCLAAEWAADGITVMNVAPGYVETDLNREFLAQENVKRWLAKRVPMQRAGDASEVAKLVGSLFADRIGYLTGETIYIDGGQGMNL